MLTNSKDSNGYLKDMRRRDEGFNEGWGKLPPPLKSKAHHMKKLKYGK